MDDISVIIPVYNRSDTLKDAIESVLIQTYKPSEIIIVDDGSFFPIDKIIKNYKNHVKIVRLEHNLGVSAARNRGIQESQCKYIAFLDSDDIFLPTKLEYQIMFMKNNQYKISHTNEFWYRNDRFVNQNKNSMRYGGYIFEKLLDKCRISPSSLMVECNVFKTCGFFNEELDVCEDYDISLRFSLNYNIGYLDKKLIIKRAIEENSLSMSIKHIEYIRYNILKNFYGTYNNSLSHKEDEAVLCELARKKSILKADHT